MSKSSPEIEYLRLIENFVESQKPKESKKEIEAETIGDIKFVTLSEFEQKIKDKNFILNVIETLQDLYDWKAEQYQSRLEELIKQYKKEENILKRANLTEEERKEIGMASLTNLKLVFASLEETFDLVNQKREYYEQVNDNLLNDMKNNFENIVYDSERGLKTLVGKQYDTIKINVCTLLSSLEGGINSFTKTFQNIVITGPAGVGKTTLARYLAYYYNQSGILATDIVNVITRPDLVGQYLGETGAKTRRKMINSLEGIIFIDEAYQLGGCPDPDSYGMESITEIVNFLDKYMALSIVIVAGYENEMKFCFFDRNEGLRRRFPNQYKLIYYEYYDLFMIFIKGCYKDLYNYYSSLANTSDPNAVFKTSFGTIDGMLNSFEYLNRRRDCKRLVDMNDPETGQYIRDSYGRYQKELKDTVCYFPNQGGDVGILVSKFFNYYYTKNVPIQSFIGAVDELGQVKDVPKQIVKSDLGQIRKFFKPNELNEKFINIPKKKGEKKKKVYEIPNLSKIIKEKPSDEVKKILDSIKEEKLIDTIDGSAKGYSSTTIKKFAQQLGIEGTKYIELAEKIKEMMDKLKPNPVPLQKPKSSSPNPVPLQKPKSPSPKPVPLQKPKSSSPKPVPLQKPKSPSPKVIPVEIAKSKKPKSTPKKQKLVTEEVEKTPKKAKVEKETKKAKTTTKSAPKSKKKVKETEGKVTFGFPFTSVNIEPLNIEKSLNPLKPSDKNVFG
jgi:DNA replication protein DnaC